MTFGQATEDRSRTIARGFGKLLFTMGSTSQEAVFIGFENLLSYMGEYDASWGHIGGCRNIPGSSSADFDFSRPTAPDPDARVVTHDQQCLGSTSDANKARCEEICTELMGTYDPNWGNIGGCRDIPGSATADLDFTRTAPPVREDS